MAQAGHEGRVALRRPEAGRRPERRAREGVRISRCIPTIAEALRCGGEQPRRRRSAGHRRARRLSDGTTRGRSCIRATTSSSSASTCSRRTAWRCRSTTTSTCRTASKRPSGWSMPSKRLKFPMLAGSSLPVTWRLPDIELPLNCEIESALMVGYGGRGRHGLPRPRGAAVHGRAAEGWRDRRQGRADDRGRRGLEGAGRRDATPESCWCPRCPGATRRRDRPSSTAGRRISWRRVSCRSWSRIRQRTSSSIATA